MESASFTNRLSDTSSVYGPHNAKGGWQGGDYQSLLIGDRNSCDSSIYAWSEDGHRSHIEAKKKNSSNSRENQKRKRSSAIVHGTFVIQNNGQEKQHLVVPTSFLQLPLTANSETLSASFSSPLLKFPSTPARSQAGQLVSQPPRSLMPAPLPSHRAQSPLIRQLSQDEVDASPVDVASIVASGWAIEPEEYSDDYNSEAASALIDSLLHGVQEGFLSSAVVDSPSRMTEIEDEDNDSQAGWETDDCEITPRLRKVWQDVDSPVASSRSNPRRSSQTVLQQSKYSESSATISSNESAKQGKRQSFVRVPSAIFPHTPSQAKAERRQSSQSISSVSSRSSRRSKQSRLSSSSLLFESDRSVKRRSIHLAATPPRPMSRKSKYYSRPTQPGAMPLLKQQHLKGARGKFWSPMNSLYLADGEDIPTVEDVKLRRSSRYSRRSGQAWVRPRTFEVKDQYRVTIYPPQVDDFYSRQVLQADPDKTPTQAQFKAATPADPPRPISRNSRASSVSRTLPPGPPPTRQLPAVPVLVIVPRKTKRLSRRASRDVRYSQATVMSTITSDSCSQCQSDLSSCSCSETLTEESRSTRASMCSGTYSNGQTEGYTESQSCSCTDASTCSCTMTRSSMISSQVESMSTPRQSYFVYRERASLDKASRVLGLPNSAPLYAPSEQPAESVYEDQPRSAPYFSAAHPPILDPLPRFSPFSVSFDDILGKRRSKRWTRYSMSDVSSRTSMMSSRCSMCVDGSELAYLGSKSEAAQSTSDGTIIVSSSMSYTSDSRSSSSSLPSTSSPMSELASDHGSENDSDMPTTPTRSEYQSSFGLSESPGIRMSFIVSPMPQSARRHSQMDELLMFSSQEEEYNDDNKTEESRMSALRPISQFTSTTLSGTTTTSSSCNSRAPRSILKTSTNYRECDQGAGATHRRPTVSMAVDTVFKSGSSTFAGKTTSTYSSSTSSSGLSTSSSSSLSRAPASHAPQRATLATSTMTKHDLEGRIQREENRQKRNESRLYALEKLEGKTKKSSLFFSLLSNTSSTSGNAGAGIWTEGEQEEELSSPLPRTPLTPAKMDLLELQRQVENRQRITQFQNNKAVSFTDVIGFDMGTYPKIPSRNTASATSQEQDALLKLQLKKLSTAIEARQYAKEKCIDK